MVGNLRCVRTGTRSVCLVPGGLWKLLLRPDWADRGLFVVADPLRSGRFGDGTGGELPFQYYRAVRSHV